MGWLDLIFGKGTARKAATAKKVLKAVSPKPEKPKPIKRPKLEWSKSENGNDTTEVDGYRITIFKKEKSWNYCVVEILDEFDIEAGEEEDPIFGDWYDTKAEARREALFEVGYE